MAEVTDTDMPNVPEWVQATVKLGIPGVALIFLVWWITQVMDKKLDAMVLEHSTISRTAGEMREIEKNGATVNERILRVLLASCVNGAKSDQARKECLQ